MKACIYLPWKMYVPVIDIMASIINNLNRLLEHLSPPVGVTVSLLK